MIETYFNKRELFQLPSFEEDWEAISSTFEQLAKGHKIFRLSEQEKKELQQQLKSFSLLQNYIDVSFIDAVILERDGKRVSLILLSISSEVSVKNRYYIRKETQVEYEFVSLITLRDNYGHVLIRPETIGDKITEIFDKTEIDFTEEKEFSKKYYMTASDEALVSEKFPRGILHAIGKQKGIHIEVIQNKLLILLKKKLCSENTIRVASLGNEILENQY